MNAHFGSTLPLAQKIAYCERIYTDRGLPVRFRITPFVQPPELEAELEARGLLGRPHLFVAATGWDEAGKVDKI